MEQKKAKGQKGFAIVNIVMGVILVMASFAMFSDPSIGPVGITALAAGAALWGTGAYALGTLRKHSEDKARMKKSKRINTICFVISCILLAVCTIMPVAGTML